LVSADAPTSNGGGPPTLPQVFDRAQLARLDAPPAVQLIARDSFVAEMAIKIDRLHTEIRALAREIELAKSAIVELKADADRNDRFCSFQEREQRARTAKVEDALRLYDDLKARLDALQGKKTGDYHSYNDFAAVSKKLTELASNQREFRSVDTKLKLSAGFFCASVLLWLFAVLAR
jgi:hypothetical protein